MSNPRNHFLIECRDRANRQLVLFCSYWLRCIEHAGPGVQARFKENVELFFDAVHVQATHRERGETPDLESYIDVRRDESGCKPVFDLIEYALDIDLPDFVIEHPVSYYLSSHLLSKF